MSNFLTSNFKRGLRQIKENPQLAYTLFVAIVIFFAFLFTSNNFLSIAKNAQDRLINVRAGSIQDVFAEFAVDHIDNSEKLSEKIKSIAENNKTIKEFKVISFEDEKKIIISSLKDSEVGEIDKEDSPFTLTIYNLATTDTKKSYTIEEIINGERFFKTSRAITDKNNNIIGLIYTKQSLSEADQMIAKGIRNSIIFLIVVLFIIMFLFFRHAKIIDYTVLYRRLEGINKMKDDFISMASHELRTPLTVIRGYADILKTSKEISKEDKKMAENIDMHSKRLGVLIDDILDISRIEQGRIKFNFEKFNPKNEIQETIEFLRYNIKEKGLKIHSKLEDSGIILADKDRLKQILVNILGNSVKYTKRGEINVEVSTDSKNLNIRVSDTGIGMNAEAQRGLFQKFYRIKSKETKDIIGTGLGLWITKKLVELMKGSISVESIKGVGTHIIISFPLINEKF